MSGNQKFSFGTHVRRKGMRDLFLVLGTEKSGRIQIATLNWKTSARPDELELA